MNFGDIFKKIRKSQDKEQKDAHSYWIKCQKCQSLMYYKEVENQNFVCPKCNFHMRIGIDDRVKLLADEETFIEFDSFLHLQNCGRNSRTNKEERYRIPQS